MGGWFDDLVDAGKKLAEQAEKELREVAERAEKEAERIAVEIVAEANKVVTNDPNLKAAAEELQKFADQTADNLKAFADTVGEESQKLGEQIESGVNEAVEELQKATEQVTNDLQTFADTVEAESQKLGEQIETGFNEAIENDPNLKAAIEDIQKATEQATESLDVFLNEAVKEVQEAGKEAEKTFQDLGEQVEAVARQVEEQGQQVVEEIMANSALQATAQDVKVIIDNATKQVQEFADITQKTIENTAAETARIFEEVGNEVEKTYLEAKDKIVETAEEAGKVLGMIPNAAPVVGEILTLALTATPKLAMNLPKIYSIYQDIMTKEVNPNTIAKVNELLDDLDTTLKTNLPDLLKNKKFPELTEQIVNLKAIKEPLNSIGLSPEFVSRSIPKLLNATADLIGSVVDIAKHATSEKSRDQLVEIINTAKNLAAIDDNNKAQKKETITALADASLALLAGNQDIQNELITSIPDVLKKHSKELGEVLQDFVQQTKIGKSLNININGEKAVNLIADRMPQITKIATLYSQHKYGTVIKKAVSLIFDKDVLKLMTSAIFSKSSNESHEKKDNIKPEVKDTVTKVTTNEKSTQPETVYQQARAVMTKMDKRTVDGHVAVANNVPNVGKSGLTR